MQCYCDCINQTDTLRLLKLEKEILEMDADVKKRMDKLEQEVKKTNGRLYFGIGTALGALLGSGAGPIGTGVGAGVGAAIGSGVYHTRKYLKNRKERKFE